MAVHPLMAIESIGPTEALRMLANNTHNRQIRQAVVDKYAADMIAGNWVFTHQGIALTEDGTVNDGQHRLKAIVQSGCTVEMAVWRGVSLESQIAVDDHAKRTNANALNLEGSFPGLRQEHTAIANVMMVAPRSDKFASKQAMRTFLKRNWAAVEFALSLFPTKVRGITFAPVPAAIARASYYIDHDKLRSFAQILVDGQSDGSDPAKTVIVLRNFLLSRIDRKGGGSQWRIEAYKKVQRAIRAFSNGELLTKAYAADEDLFPLPPGS